MIHQIKATQSLRRAAKRLARHGVYVFPLKGKEPRTTNGHKDATTDADTIDQWWRQYPDANIGIALRSSNLVVVDVDGPDGHALVRSLSLPDTYTVRTGRGYHYYFEAGSTPIGRHTNVKGAKLDVLGDGYVVAAPSLHPTGQRYSVRQKRKPAPLPSNVIALIRGAAKPSNRAGASVAERHGEIPEGRRDVRLYRLARALHRQAYSEAEILDVLRDRNKSKCRPPLPDAQLQKIARSAVKKQVGDLEPVPSQADRLVQIALERYRLGVTPEGDAFAVAKAGPNIARMFRGNRDSLRAELAREFRRKWDQTPTASALGDALTVLEGEAAECNPEPVALRVARYKDGIVVDLGDATGRVIIVTPAGWRIEDQSPVLFRRSALTHPLPAPERGGTLIDLQRFLNVTTDTFGLAIGWMVASWIPNIPHPILLLGGEQGAGKSTTARHICALLDPSPASLRAQPRDAEQWTVAAAGSWCLAVDNVSAIAPWWSDTLCKAVTGDALVRRRLYSDSDVSVLAFRRCVILTSIDVAILRGDLADRLLLLDLKRIKPHARRSEAALGAEWAAQYAPLLGALLDVLSAVLRTLPNLPDTTLPRMADFARVLAALDIACPELTNNGTALHTYKKQATRLSWEVIESEPIAALLRQWMRDRWKIDKHTHTWTGTTSALLTELHDIPVSLHLMAHKQDWPGSARALAGTLRRIMPALRNVGVDIHVPAHKGAGRRITISYSPPPGQKSRAKRLRARNGVRGQRPQSPPNHQRATIHAR